MAFQLYIPKNLEFRDYIAIVQTARAFADGYDKKDALRLCAVIGPQIEVDYRLVSDTILSKTYNQEDFIAEFLSPELLGNRRLLTQHLLGQCYFKSVSPSEIVVQWQQIAGHGRWMESSHPLKKQVDKTSDGRTYMEQRYTKIDECWKIAGLKPSMLYESGEFEDVVGEQ
ncbi:NTF2-like protein [Aspergillus eucalypticola CBS 122712]|uniref:NTF2-like protein n=1 Tax=Aspergillus eucalypticola (strain CBS 122712 / IBT 29274) TaxID=1448314 RepID=A0A317UTP9_ASPEC|nr:NTF2-like protein [Aspergillus eucalypticola CBS 122712]PWY65414.1 NTF2-like protein [Aspergillus eucalypticola CBS 122712]